MSVKNITKNQDLNLARYVNIETGELLADELNPGTRITVSTQDSNLVTITSDQYLIVDLEALNRLTKNKIISNADVGKIVTMAETLKTEYNAMYNHTIPHTLETISELISNNYDYTTKFIKKLCRKNVVHRYVTSDKTLYCINPFLTRRRKTISKELLEIFGTFKK